MVFNNYLTTAELTSNLNSITIHEAVITSINSDFLTRHYLTDEFGAI